MERKLSRQTLAVLRAFLDAPTEPHYGLELGEAARLRTGSLYPILARLEDAGWLRGEWEETSPRATGRPRRRYYTLTPTGLVEARREVDLAVRELGGLAPVVQPG